MESELRKHRDHLEELVAEALDRVRKLNKDLSRRAEELANTNIELESFNYSVSHDLRAPLRSINGFSQIIFDQYRDKLDKTGKEYLQIITSECKRMGQLIRRFVKPFPPVSQKGQPGRSGFEQHG